jgi:CBS domain-containing protein
MQRSPSAMKVFDVMSTDLVTGQINEPLSETVHRMLERDVGCIIVMNDSTVDGIITKGDVLKKAFLLGLDAREVSSKKVMSTPVISIDPDSTLEEASRMMTRNNVSKLAVVKGRKLVGVVTSSDIIRAEPMQVGYLQELVKARFVPHDIA